MLIALAEVAVGRWSWPAWAGVLVSFAAACAAAADAQTANKRSHPDLEGVWSYNSITTLERPAAFKVLEPTEAEARAFEASHPGTPEPARGGPVGQDDSEWWEMGKLGRLRGKPRSSWVVDPADGKLPYAPAGLSALAAAQAAGMRNFDGPEVRPASERCLMGTGGGSLPPMLNAGYGALLRIVQTKDHVVILTEMNVGPRIIPLKPGPTEPGPDWNGRSTGRWEGETLVVETTGFQPGAQWRAPSRLFITSAGKVTERFTRVGRDQILYAFTVDDPQTFARVWRGEMPLNRTPERMFEFACHEGNYSLAGVLAGARRQAGAGK